MAEETILAPSWYAVVPFVGFALLATLSVTVPQSGDSRSSDASAGSRTWPAIPGIMLVFSAVWCLLGNYEGELRSLIIYTVILVVCGVISAMRDGIRALINKGGMATRVARDVICVVAVMLATLIALEIPWNDSFPALARTGLAIECGLIAIIHLALFFLGQRSGALMASAIFMAGFAGIANSFLIKFKGVALLPSDLYALSTAAAVKEGYSFIAGVRQLWGVEAGAIGMMFASLLGAQRVRKQNPSSRPMGRHAALLSDVQSEDEPEEKPLSIWMRILIFVINLALGSALAYGAWWALTEPDYIHDLEINFDYTHTVDRYKENGFLTSFVAAWQDFPIKKPNGYTKAAAKQVANDLLTSYKGSAGRTEAVAQFEKEQPTIIVVMNESFSDLSVFDGMRSDYQGPTYFKSIDNALCRGDLAVSVLGGGTCNTEFEFLTGYSYAFVGAGKYPYVTYDLSGSASLARQLRDLGYATHAIHPNEASNWNRSEVYNTLGFDEFHAIDEFEGAPTLHMGVTDAATYDKVLELLSLDSRPQFIFDVTMQNHSSYNLDDIPTDQLTDYQPEGDVANSDTAQLNEYLSCIEASDKDLEAFMGKLKDLDRKVVLVFFGDHQPTFTPVFNDLYFPNEDEVTHQERIHQSSYFIWANYDIAGRAQKSAVDNTSADVLGAMTLDLVGAPLTDLQKERLVTRSQVPALNLFGYQGADGVWRAPDEDSEYKWTYDQISWINFLNFGSRVQDI